MPFLDPLVTEDVGDGNVMIYSEFRYAVRDTSTTLDIPIGFVTDYASIPRILRPIITGHDNTKKPAVLHDYLYRKGIGKRKWADKLFLVAMKECGVPWWKRRMAYRGVRLGGGFSWKGQ